jgi:hypothetical protein
MFDAVSDFGLSCKLYAGSVKEITTERDVQSMCFAQVSRVEPMAVLVRARQLIALDDMQHHIGWHRKF